MPAPAAPVRAVVVPATPLLVPGAAGAAEVLVAVRAAVRRALRELAAADPGGPAPAVLAHGPVVRAGRLRPSLAAVGVADRWVPLLGERTAAGTGSGDDGVAGVPASVALLALADAGLAAGVTVEVPAAAGPDDVAAAVAALGTGPVVVAGGGVPGGPERGPAALAPGVAAVLAALAAAGGWEAGPTAVPAHHEHLPAAYHVTVHRGRAPGR
ncbi:hypothetical protein [Puerhibacterium sp. TATVAM-FAB25]|uniref:hypothetical protein n=1 Tax=Puerhibacterium sp. TATVAM-FAB25 TaxID=3093699 RepID=UPI003979D9EE